MMRRRKKQMFAIILTTTASVKRNTKKLTLSLSILLWQFSRQENVTQSYDHSSVNEGTDGVQCRNKRPHRSHCWDAVPCCYTRVERISPWMAKAAIKNHFEYASSTSWDLWVSRTMKAWSGRNGPGEQTLKRKGPSRISTEWIIEPRLSPLQQARTCSVESVL